MMHKILSINVDEFVSMSLLNSPQLSLGLLAQGRNRHQPTLGSVMNVHVCIQRIYGRALDDLFLRFAFRNDDPVR
jgi:hypothetical protein